MDHHQELTVDSQPLRELVGTSHREGDLLDTLLHTQ